MNTTELSKARKLIAHRISCKEYVHPDTRFDLWNKFRNDLEMVFETTNNAKKDMLWSKVHDLSSFETELTRYAFLVDLIAEV